MLATLASLPLIPIGTAQPELVIKDAGSRMLHTTGPNDDSTSSTERVYNPEKDCFIPIYVVEKPRTGWTIRVLYSDAHLEADYPFWDRDAAFQFQKLLTGYIPLAYCEKANCSATFKSSLWRNSLYGGVGEFQLWCSEEAAAAPPTSPASATASRTNFQRSSISSASSMASQSSGLEYSHSLSTNVTTIVCRKPQAPLLIAFLRDSVDGHKGGYTMLRAESR